MPSLFDNVVTSGGVYKGAGRFVWAASGTSFPGSLESVIQPATPADPHETAYNLGAAWTDFGGTSDEGITVLRELEVEDGVAIDQLTTPLFEGDPGIWRMRVRATLMETDPTSLSIAWELPTPTTLAADTGPDYRVAQTKAKFGAPTSLTERLVAVIQQHSDTDKLRVFVFRKAKITAGSFELVMQKGVGGGAPVEFLCHPDTDVLATEDRFGALYEED